VIDFLQNEMGVKTIRFPESSGIGLKPVSERAPSASCAPPANMPSKQGSKSVTLVHKGNIMKYTEGAFAELGLRSGAQEFGDVADGGPWCRLPNGKIIKDVIADIVPAADPHPPEGVRCDRHHEPQRRLHQRCAGRPGGRHRHRTGRQHQLR
jgi:isocitrate dehydrogenase